MILSTNVITIGYTDFTTLLKNGKIYNIPKYGAIFNNPLKKVEVKRCNESFMYTYNNPGGVKKRTIEECERDNIINKEVDKTFGMDNKCKINIFHIFK